MAIVAALLVAAPSAFAGRIALPAKPDPILDGGDTHPCLAGADLASGIDVTGQPIVPADIDAPPVPLPGQVLVPLGGNAQRRDPGRGRAPVPGPGNAPYVALDGSRLAPLLNPAPCPR